MVGHLNQVAQFVRAPAVASKSRWQEKVSLIRDVDPYQNRHAMFALYCVIARDNTFRHLFLIVNHSQHKSRSIEFILHLTVYL